MFNFHIIRQFFNSPSVLARQPPVQVLTDTKTASTHPVHLDWTHTRGRFYQLRQERHVTCRNSEISGTCQGQARELVGSAMIGLFKGLPEELPSLLIKLAVWADEGELTVSVCDYDGTIVRAVVPTTLEANVELSDGRAWMRCEAGSTPVRNIRYEATII